MSEQSDVLKRFIRYCEVASQSNPLTADTVPSTPAQHAMAQTVAKDLEELGAEDIMVDTHAYVTAHWPASAGAENLPTLGFCCHPKTNPQLEHMVGFDLVTSDGTSLLGGDDKAGVAMVVSLLHRLRENPQLPHPRLAIAFVPDEEIGHGAALLDLDAFGAAYGYTIDGGPLGEFCYETFNAAEVHVQATGLSVHTGTAKGIMINAAEALMRFHQLLPPQDRPEYTEGYDGFFYLERMQGDCEYAQADYIIRDHDQKKVEKRKQMMRDAVSYINYQLDSEALTISVKDQYHNLADVIMRPENEHLIENARVAYAAIGQEMTCIPMRGGTDGSQLSFRGFPCANLSACYYNAHGVREFVPVPELEAMVDMLQALVALYAKKSL